MSTGLCHLWLKPGYGAPHAGDPQQTLLWHVYIWGSAFEWIWDKEKEGCCDAEGYLIPPLYKSC